ncbi:TadE/TadG family type IV pilus assembly protein [Chthonobacter rhizosphaerae]|uniref:TadE/TadG family type IV pilus assembly protein n=1 Tax=Chthonobacter rhizosphaerae TaxID=2735553 RepID=UPI002483506A|nr:pilus assembly protein [Chthonobacter rhizosphaerae]
MTRRSLWRDRSGATALMFSIAAVPVLLTMGAGMDYTRQYNAKVHAQEVLDGALLAASSSHAANEEEIRDIVEAYVAANTNPARLQDPKVYDIDFDDENDRITASLAATIEPMFVRIAGVDTLGVDVASSVLRGVAGSLEVALVLDNTWSMSETDAAGVKKIDALKKAATSLVNELKKDDAADVKVAIVPYADYVNVGTSNRNASWLSVPADYSVTTEKVCTTKTTYQSCTKKTCTRTVDGVVEYYECNDVCTTYEGKPYQSCTGGTTNYKWYGCVGSRRAANLRLADTQTDVPYPGLLATSRNCLNPIVPLTTSKSTLTTAINGLIINVGGYKPLTYIPAGLIWGVNVLSPTAPFSEGKTYDTKNMRPRKVLVLMTDGENTLRFDSADGKHKAPSGNATAKAAQLKATNKDTVSICTYAKSKNIEIYTVALAVDDADAKVMLGDCASGSDHFFDTSSTSAMASAFAVIAASLREIRLER